MTNNTLQAEHAPRCQWQERIRDRLDPVAKDLAGIDSLPALQAAHTIVDYGKAAATLAAAETPFPDQNHVDSVLSDVKKEMENLLKKYGCKTCRETASKALQLGLLLGYSPAKLGLDVSLIWLAKQVTDSGISGLHLLALEALPLATFDEMEQARGAEDVLGPFWGGLDRHRPVDCFRIARYICEMNQKLCAEMLEEARERNLSPVQLRNQCLIVSGKRPGGRPPKSKR